MTTARLGLLVIFVVAWSLLIYAPTAGGTERPGYEDPPNETVKTLTAEFADYISVADLICACEFLDDGVTRKVDYSTRVVQTAAVSEVFFGDPSLRTIEVDKEYSRSGKGDKVLLLTQLGSTQIVTNPDTPAEREELQKAIRVAQRMHLERRFIDPDKLLAAAEELLRDYLAKLADRYPDHPWVGRNAVRAVKAVSCPAPLGSHILIVGGLKPLETDQGRADIPRGDGLILWVGVGTNPHRNFTIGRPDKDHIVKVTRDYVENRHPVVSYQTADLGAIESPVSMHLVTVTPDPDGRGRFGGELHTVFREVTSRRLNELNADPPRNIDAAIDCLAAAAPADDATRKLFLDRPAYWAYAALQSSYAKGAMDAQQKLRLVPMLIEWLMDTSVVQDKRPCDGVLTLAHHMAYPLLCAITGEKFPPAIDRPRESLDFPAGPPLNQAQLEAARKRQQVWRDWWEKDGRPQTASAAGVGR